MKSHFQQDLAELLQAGPSRFVHEMSCKFDAVAGAAANSIVLFGAGPLGRHTLAVLRTIGVEPVAFADNNTSLWGTEVDGLKVTSPSDAAQAWATRAAFVVTIYNSSGAVRQLTELGCVSVLPFASLYRKYAEAFLPYYGLALPGGITAARDDIVRAMSLWKDAESATEYVDQLSWRTGVGPHALPRTLSPSDTYLDSQLFPLRDDEVVVDCGAFDGDTVRAFLSRTNGSFSSIIAIEPDPLSFQKLETFVAGLGQQTREKIAIHRVAVGSEPGTVLFNASGSVAASKSCSGNTTVPCVPLDDLLENRRPTYIKMDIEGSEPDAIRGAKRTIVRDAPVLAISLYHHPDHLWSIPLLIESINPHYDLYLRRYAEDCWELVCYAIPRRR
jgi:FkbM family methyltransferase